MKKAVGVTVICVLIAVLAAYSVEAKRPGRWWRERGDAAELSLKDDQLEALDAASFEHRAKAIELGACLAQKRNEVEYLLNQETIDRKAVLKAAGEMAHVRTLMLANRIDQRLAMCGVLSPLQQEKVEEIRDRGRDHRHEKEGGRAASRMMGKKNQRPMRGDAACKWWEDPRLAGEVGLTDEQRTQLRTSFYKVGQERIDLRAQKEIKELSLRRALDAADVDRTEIDGLVDGIGKIETALAKNRSEAMISEREILTAEQLDKLKTIRAEEAMERRKLMRERALDREGGKKKGQEEGRGPRVQG